MDDWGIDELINKGGVMIMNNCEIYKESIGKLLKETDDINFEIRLRRHKNNELTKEYDKEIEELQKRLIETEATLEKTLTESKEEAIKVKCGWTHFRIMPDKVTFTGGAIEEVETKYPDSKEKYIKVEKSLKLNPLKKDIEEGIIELENMTKEPQDKKFEYKYTGEE